MIRKVVIAVLFGCLMVNTLSACAIISYYEDDEVQWESYTSKLQGVTLDHPDYWIIEDDEDTLVIADNEETLEADDENNVKRGAAVLIDVSMMDEVGVTDPLAFTEFFVAMMDTQEEGEILIAPTPLEINQQSAATATFVGEFEGVEGVFKVTSIAAHGKMVLAIESAFGAAAFLEDDMTRMVESLVIAP